jgi:hypothetical protein
VKLLAENPRLLLWAAAAIIVLSAATGIGQALRIGLRTHLLRLMGIEPPPVPGSRRVPE